EDAVGEDAEARTLGDGRCRHGGQDGTARPGPAQESCPRVSARPRVSAQESPAGAFARAGADRIPWQGDDAGPPWAGVRLSRTAAPRMDRMKIGLLTAGGDCPGLNAVIRGVVLKGDRIYDHEFVGVKDGFRGLVEDYIVPLPRQRVRGLS